MILPIFIVALQSMRSKILESKPIDVDATRVAVFASNLTANIPNIESLGIIERMKIDQDAIKALKQRQNLGQNKCNNIVNDN